MRKQATKRGFLLGLLVGLVMLIGASPAMAGYIYLGNFIDSWSSSNPGYGEFIDPYNSTITYTYTGNNVFKINGSIVDPAAVLEDEDPLPWMDAGATFSFTGGSVTGGTWTSPFDVGYFTVKSASASASGAYVALFKYDGSGSAQTFTFDISTYISTTKGISNVRLYNNVPIPGALWLLGSGLSALLVARRRRKRN